MTKNRKLRVIVLFIPIILLVLLIVLGSFYACWNSSSPERTCSSCHEISKSVNMFAQSAHRKLTCQECHGTALSNGFHSLKEKGSMVVHHVSDKFIEDIRLNEEQILEVMDNCKRCHNSEYARWSAGGHSARYKDILLDKKHNQTEQINEDCLRCHGMFSDLPVRNIVQPLDKTGPWKLIKTEMSDKHTIPCMACHQIHNKGFPRVNPDYSNPKNIFYSRQDSSANVSLYYRPDKLNISVEYLPKLLLWEGDRPVNVSGDLLTRICVQCHSPNSHHQAGTSDDRTPRGVHEGIGCTTCHESHSNDARQSCIKCHPAISNCKIDVQKMNTSFKDSGNPNNIHWVACTDCHMEKSFKRKK